jgi:hypothetical protein
LVKTVGAGLAVVNKHIGNSHIRIEIVGFVLIVDELLDFKGTSSNTS